MIFSLRSLLQSLTFLLLCSLVATLPVQAETKVLTTEATYTMGDGETPSFAEAMALQKAKQTALEQAGTYVESYTKTKNYDLTHEEIQTIAGGLLVVEVLEKTRTLIGDGLRFFVRIKATVTTDKMAELAQRIKGKNVGEEYKKLQEDYARLNKEIETWKQMIAKTAPGPEREAALDEIREREKAFVVVQRSEKMLLYRLVSGESLVTKAGSEKNMVDTLLSRIIEQGVDIHVGEPGSHLIGNDLEFVAIDVRVNLRLNEAILHDIREVAELLGGRVFSYSRSINYVSLAKDPDLT